MGGHEKASAPAPTEVAPGIYRIESTLGPRPFAQYLLRGERTMLVDTGVAETPAATIFPALGALGLTPADLDVALITHADADHYGGNAAVHAAAPRALFCAHAADAPWIEDRVLVLRERYGWYDAHGLGYAPDVAAWLRDAGGAPTALDLYLVGGETFRLGPRLAVEVLHLPGHSPGHLGLWEPTSRTAIVTDAVLAGGLLDHDGRIISPPPYFDAAAYERTIGLLRGLAPQRLLTAHYAIIAGEAVARFLADSAAFVARARATVREEALAAGAITLRELLDRANPRLGPFTVMANELAGPLRAHLRELVGDGMVSESAGPPPTWRVAG